MNCFYVECGSWWLAKAIVSSIKFITSDSGTESGVSISPVIHGADIFPHWDPRQDLVPDEAVEDVPMDDSHLSFGGAMRIQGIEHVCCRALCQIDSKLPDYPFWLKRAIAFGKALTDNYYASRLRHLCLNNKRGSDRLLQAFFYFTTRPDERRFSNLVEFCEQ